MSPIEQLAGDARAALKSGAGSERRARQRARLLAAPFRRERGARLAWRWAPVAAATGAGMLVRAATAAAERRALGCR